MSMNNSVYYVFREDFITPSYKWGTTISDRTNNSVSVLYLMSNFVCCHMGTCRKLTNIILAVVQSSNYNTFACCSNCRGIIKNYLAIHADRTTLLFRAFGSNENPLLPITKLYLDNPRECDAMISPESARKHAVIACAIESQANSDIARVIVVLYHEVVFVAAYKK